jgi:predicted RNase H-like HicB family nuclease
MPATESQRVTSLHIEVDQEEDGRWIAEVMELPGVIVYGDSQNNAIARVKALALRVLADSLERGEFSVSNLQFAIT